MKKLFSLILAAVMLAAFVPAAFADAFELEPIYETYGLGEEIFICGTAPRGGVTIALRNPVGDYVLFNTYDEGQIADGVYIGVGNSFELGVYSLFVIGGGESMEFVIEVVKDRVDHGSKPTNSGNKTEVTATDVYLSQNELELKYGESAQVTVSGEKSVFKWTTDDTDKITLSSETAATVTITAKKTGTAVVWVYCGNNYATLNIKITPADKNQSTVTKPDENKTDENQPENNAGENKPEADLFTDLAGVEWAKESINSLAKAGVINGMGGGIFAPESGVTRAQFVKMVTEAFALTDKGGASFLDIDGQWYAGYVLTAASNGIINGYEGYFMPEDGVTCRDAALIVKRVLDMKGVKLPEAAADEASGYAGEAVAAMRAAGIITDSMGFSPLAAATRAQSAYMIYGAYKLAGSEGAENAGGQ